MGPDDACPIGQPWSLLPLKNSVPGATALCASGFRKLLFEVVCGIVWSLGASTVAYRGQGQEVQKVMVQPINLIFRYLQNRSRIQVWLYEQVNMRIEGCIIGFDEYMNLVLDDAEEIHSTTKSRKQLGRIMLKGDNITLLQSVSN
nr:small nuclear ribonucleoprotein E-like [Kogia breviceps]